MTATRNTVSDAPALSRKVGTEDIVMIRLPVGRVHGVVPKHREPTVDDRSRCRVALLAQACRRVSFDQDEVGPSDELHFWLQIGTAEPGVSMGGADAMLPSMQWLALGSAASSEVTRAHLRSFGLRPAELRNVSLGEAAGSTSYSAGGRIDWAAGRPGARMPCAGVRHLIFVAADGPDAPGHRVAALLKDAVLNQVGNVCIRTTALEPFLFEGENLPAVIHRMSALKADIVWQRHPSEEIP